MVLQPLEKDNQYEPLNDRSDDGFFCGGIVGIQCHGIVVMFMMLSKKKDGERQKMRERD
jgi:hypothetical protein